MCDKPNQPVQLNRTPETSSPRGISLFPTEKGFPAWDFGFPSYRKSDFLRAISLFPHRKSDFLRGISFFLHGKSNFLRGILLFPHGKSVPRAFGYVSTRG